MTTCLFNHLTHYRGIKYRTDTKAPLNLDAVYFDYSANKDVFVSYFVDASFISSGASGLIYFNQLTEQQKTKLASDMIKASSESGKIPHIGYKNDEQFNTDNKIAYFYPEDYLTSEVNHSEKISDFLKEIYSKSTKDEMFKQVNPTILGILKCKIVSVEECLKIVQLLQRKNFLEYIHMSGATNFLENSFQLTLEGHEYFREKLSLNSKKVFIAMDFNWERKLSVKNLTNSDRDKYRETVIAACKDCGYEASPVTNDHTNYITDQIIAEIKEAKFIITDFTFNNRGAYFEAGFSRALNKDVIHTVNVNHIKGSNDFEELHFDIKHINYIEWSDLAQLKKDLIYRIKALGH